MGQKIILYVKQEYSIYNKDVINVLKRYINFKLNIELDIVVYNRLSYYSRDKLIIIDDTINYNNSKRTVESTQENKDVIYVIAGTRCKANELPDNTYYITTKLVNKQINGKGNIRYFPQIQPSNIFDCLGILFSDTHMKGYNDHIRKNIEFIYKENRDNVYNGDKFDYINIIVSSLVSYIRDNDNDELLELIDVMCDYINDNGYHNCLNMIEELIINKYKNKKVSDVLSIIDLDNLLDNHELNNCDMFKVISSAIHVLLDIARDNYKRFNIGNKEYIIINNNRYIQQLDEVSFGYFMSLFVDNDNYSIIYKNKKQLHVKDIDSYISKSLKYSLEIFTKQKGELNEIIDNVLELEEEKFTGIVNLIRYNI